jgi:uncharacterized protein YdhG (YjbR/CyaY superfamily)
LLLSSWKYDLDIIFILKYLYYKGKFIIKQGFKTTPKSDKEISMSPKTDMKKSTKNSAEGFTAEEKAAMKARVQEMKAEARAGKDRAEGEKAILAAIGAMKEPDRSMGKRLHEIVTASAPALMPKTWYGMPAYADADGKVICFFQAAGKFNVRYATFGFQPDAKLDEGSMWPTSFALKELTTAEEAKIGALVKKAAG